MKYSCAWNEDVHSRLAKEFPALTMPERAPLLSSCRISLSRFLSEKSVSTIISVKYLSAFGISSEIAFT